MLLALDESDKKQKIQCIGLVALPDQYVAEFEAAFAGLRLKNKFWQELKWEKIRADNAYADRYKPFIDLFFKSHACFYVWSYPFPRKQDLVRYFDNSRGMVFHKYAYKLLASTGNKIGIAKHITNPNLHIVYDKGTYKSEEQIQFTKKLLLPKMKVPVVHCCEADSKILSLLQITDLLTGSAAAEANGEFTSKGKLQFYDYIIEKNKGMKIFSGQPVMPFGDLKIDGFAVTHPQPVTEFSVDDLPF
ncbi:MAG TPA: hypothetical protein VGF75_02720 [Candidatus Saccharimonadales bacterium]|jgi:hypothetical protein